LSLSGRRCVVVGDDPDPARLQRSAALVATIPPVDYRPELLQGAFVVFCFDADRAPAVSRDARAAHALFYAPDRPDLSDFAMPAVARRGAISLAASTDGEAPALAARLRAELQRLLDEAPGLDALVDDLIRERTARHPGHARAEALRAQASALTIEGAIRIAKP
jgi:precorrin-2 dehydrogenase/sirohydrochlorin ferrochelatase